MTQIEKYIERLKTLQNLYEEGQPQHNAFGIAIAEANEMLVKNCSIPVVVGRSEQLKCDCCNGTGMVEGDYRDELESCLTCNGRGTF